MRHEMKGNGKTDASEKGKGNKKKKRKTKRRGTHLGEDEVDDVSGVAATAAVESFAVFFSSGSGEGRMRFFALARCPAEVSSAIAT